MESFKEIEDDHSNHFFVSGKADKIEQNLLGMMGFYQFIGKTLELYLVRLADTLTSMLGSKETEEKN